MDHFAHTHSTPQRGFGFVTFADPEAAEAARNFWDQQDFRGRKLRVRVFHCFN